MIISIASGKGGTGKTSLALLLAAAHSDLTLVDCDVEEPNCHLFLQPKWQGDEQKVTVKIPHIQQNLCNACGACSAVCLFNAIAVTSQSALLFDELCHSCGGCLLACRQGAIHEVEKSIGTMNIGIASTVSSVRLLNGTLQIGTPSAVPLLKQIKKEIKQIKGDLLLDSPPGTSCSMVMAVKDSDYCILITEPNPFGLHDLELAMNITKLLNIPTGVVINKSDGADGDESIQALCIERNIPILGKIPHSVSFAQQYASGIISDEFQGIGAEIWRQLELERGGKQ